MNEWFLETYLHRLIKILQFLERGRTQKTASGFAHITKDFILLIRIIDSYYNYYE